jgi:molecular chaperone GrpE
MRTNEGESLQESPDGRPAAGKLGPEAEGLRQEAEDRAAARQPPREGQGPGSETTESETMESQASETAESNSSPEAAEGFSDEEGGPEIAVERALAEEALLRDRLLRLAAEFDNYRKRAQRERQEASTRAKAELLEKLLGPIDDLSRVAHPETEAGPPDPRSASLLAGIELVERKMLQVLEREGLQPIEAEGATFDPTIHEAVLTAPTDDPELDGKVAQVLASGYRFADRLLRPAKVVVWKAPERPSGRRHQQ